jgi:hypothetical protein
LRPQMRTSFHHHLMRSTLIFRYQQAGRPITPSLGHVWTAPDWQELFTLMQHWSGAVMCPAC